MQQKNVRIKHPTSQKNKKITHHKLDDQGTSPFGLSKKWKGNYPWLHFHSSWAASTAAIMSLLVTWRAMVRWPPCRWPWWAPPLHLRLRRVAWDLAWRGWRWPSSYPLDHLLIMKVVRRCGSLHRHLSLRSGIGTGIGTCGASDHFLSKIIYASIMHMKRQKKIVHWYLICCFARK